MFVLNGWLGVIVASLVFVALAGAVSYVSVRLARRRSDNTVVIGLFMLAAVFGIVAIFALTFLRKSLSS